MAQKPYRNLARFLPTQKWERVRAGCPCSGWELLHQGDRAVHLHRHSSAHVGSSPIRGRRLVYKFSLRFPCDKQSSHWFCRFPSRSDGLLSSWLLCLWLYRSGSPSKYPTPNLFLSVADAELAAVRGGRSPGTRKALAEGSRVCRQPSPGDLCEASGVVVWVSPPQ